MTNFQKNSWITGFAFSLKQHHQNPWNSPHFNFKKEKKKKKRQIPAVLAEQMPILSEAFPSSLMQHLEWAEHPLAALCPGFFLALQGHKTNSPQIFLSSNPHLHLSGCVLTQRIFYAGFSWSEKLSQSGFWDWLTHQHKRGWDDLPTHLVCFVELAWKAHKKLKEGV